MKKTFVLTVLAAVVIATASFAATPGKVALGIDTVSANLGAANAAAMVVKYNFTNAITGQLGLNYSNGKAIGGASNSQTGLSVRANYFLPKTFGAAEPFIGAQYSTDGATTATSIISVLLGVEAEIADGVRAGTGIIPYSAATRSGASDSTVNTGTDNQNARSVFISFAFDLN